ncbi:MAG: hypothetical protein DI533_21095 [Cereibacter sphaeroides]|uniref:VPLPA-CTERM sorting domain-containing protein n=1 Tax=Cereibacter sphaeroides TaxID=1063 RepID=A0A2W5RWL0_CERSP|nr:MAG: hypothetical protein DI533_21095 [Cereibacter sphaeroides]
MGMIKSITLAAGFSLAGAFAAGAATLDFTDLATFTGPNALYANNASASGTIGTGLSKVTWTATASQTPMKYNMPDGNGVLSGYDNGYDGAAGSKAPLQVLSGLKLDGDGLGIGDDEITIGERITITFDKAIRLTGIYVLDLFQGIHEGQFGQEIAYSTGDFLFSLTGTQNKGTGNNAGYKFAAVDSGDFNVTSITFRAKATNAFGDDGKRDYALAALDFEIAPVPVPAAGLLLLTAVGGLAAARRRKA